MGGADTPSGRGWLKMWILMLLAPTFAVIVLFLISRRKTYSIKGKHVMITGGSSGIGKSIGAEAIRKGASVVSLIARNKEKLCTAKEELDKIIPHGSKQSVHVVALDVSEADKVLERIPAILKEVGCVDVLINSAGITHTATLLETPTKIYEDLLKVNVLGSVYITKAVLPYMVERNGGAIVFISSQVGQLGLYGYTAYSTTKFGLRGLAETLQMELKPYNIGVSISFPPDTDTPQHREEVKHRGPIQMKLASFGKVFQVEDIASDVVRGVERGVFQITHGFDGFILGITSAGMSPIHATWDGIVQILLMGVFRGVALVYLALFNRVVAKGKEKIK